MCLDICAWTGSVQPHRQRLLAAGRAHAFVLPILGPGLGIRARTKRVTAVAHAPMVLLVPLGRACWSPPGLSLLVPPLG